MSVKEEYINQTIILRLGRRDVRVDIQFWLMINGENDKVELHIWPNFELEITRKMDYLNEQYTGEGPLWQEVMGKLEEKYPNDAYRKELLNKIIFIPRTKRDWKKYMMSKYMLSKAELDKAIEEIEEIISKCRGGSDILIDDIVVLGWVSAMKKRCTIEVCDLSEFEWYEKSYGRIRSHIGRRGIIAHNGIVFGNMDRSYESALGIELAIGAIILLKDKYQPYLDIVRDELIGLPLELESELAVLSRTFRQEGFSLITRLKISEKSPDLTMENYSELLENREDLAKQLLFDTEDGILSNEDLETKLLEKKEIRCLFDKGNFLYKGDRLVYEYLCIAFLREHYLSCFDFSSQDFTIIIAKKERELSEDYKRLFSVIDFLPPINENTIFLTKGYSDWRCPCNESHRLSQFIIENGSELNKRVPGIFRELLRVLREDKRNKLINNVNHLLQDLRKFPGGFFEIPDELFLTEKDLD